MYIGNNNEYSRVDNAPVRQRLRAVNEGLSEAELALFDLLRRDNLTKAELERLKQASKILLSKLRALLAPRSTGRETPKRRPK